MTTYTNNNSSSNNNHDDRLPKDLKDIFTAAFFLDEFDDIINAFDNNDNTTENNEIIDDVDGHDQNGIYSVLIVQNEEITPVEPYINPKQKKKNRGFHYNETTKFFRVDTIYGLLKLLMVIKKTNCSHEKNLHFNNKQCFNCKQTLDKLYNKRKRIIKEHREMKLTYKTFDKHINNIKNMVSYYLNNNSWRLDILYRVCNIYTTLG